jgi:1-phosphatidylinositol phosphodiesterase
MNVFRTITIIGAALLAITLGSRADEQRACAYDVGWGWCRDNHVYLNSSTNLGLKCDYLDSDRTSGQPWCGFSSSTEDDNLDILIKCGRKHSTTPADWFKRRLYNDWSAIARSNSHLPKDLNFSVLIRLIINNHHYHVQVAQGYDVDNNWWLGGENLVGYFWQDMLSTTDGRYTFKLPGSSYDMFFNVYANRINYNWMELYIDDDTKLSDFVIPGTHDTGTYAIYCSGGGYNPFVTCQQYAILTQLCAGVRALDIRLGLVDGDLSVYHASYKADLTFDAVLRQASDFLDAHPQETVIMTIKHEYGADVADAFYDALKARDSTLSKYWLKNAMPTMGDVRGKIVFINRDRNIDSEGIQVTWKDNTTFTSTGKVNFDIQDCYAVGFSDKETAFEDLLKKQVDSSGSYWYFNYLSLAASHGDLATKSNAKHLNGWAKGKLEPYSKSGSEKLTGIVIMDFAGEVYTPDIISYLVDNNQIHSSNSLALKGADTPKVSFRSQRYPGTESNMVDKFTFNFTVDIEDENIDPTMFLTPASQLDFTCGEYAIAGADGRLGYDREGVFSGAKGSAVLSPYVDDRVVVMWDNKSITVSIEGNFQSSEGGPNILDLSGLTTNQSVTDYCDFKLRLGSYVWAGTLSYSGRADTGSWDVNSTALYPLPNGNYRPRHR